MSFRTTHNLKFEVAHWEWNHLMPNEMVHRFRVGTCHGLFYQNKSACVIIALDNHQKGNGHFEDVLEWFYYSCKRHNLDFMIVEIMNQRLYTHLKTKRGFQDTTKLGNKKGVDLIKHFRK